MNQLRLLMDAVPRIHAAESLQYHLLCAGLNAACMIDVAEEGVCVVLILPEPYRRTLNTLEHAGLDARLMFESKSDLIDVRTYETDVLGQQVTIVIQPPIATHQLQAA